jgi:hypothetical protein
MDKTGVFLGVLDSLKVLVGQDELSKHHTVMQLLTFRP